MRVAIVSMLTFSSRSYRGFLDEIASRVDSLTVITGDMPTRWSTSAEPKDPGSAYALHPMRPRLAISDASTIFPGLRGIIRESAPDVVHIYAEPWQLLAIQAVAAAKKSHAATGIQFYENGPRMRGYGGSARRLVGARVLRRCDYAVGMTSQSAEVARQMTDTSDITVVPPPLGLGRFDTPQKADMWFGEGSSQRFRLAFVGNHAEHKGVDDLLKLCELL